MYYRTSKMSGKVYAVEFNDLNDEMENISLLVREGTPVIIGDDLDDIAELFNIETSEIIIV
jgi:hypothetical protein